MATILPDISRTFGEYLLIPGLTTEDTTPDKVLISSPMTRFFRDNQPDIKLNIPFVSAIMQSVSNDSLAIALARQGGLSFIFCSQPIQNQAKMVSRVKRFKAGFVASDTNLSRNSTMADVLQLTAKTGHSTVVITEDGDISSPFIGLITSLDYQRDVIPTHTKVADIMIPVDKLVCGHDGMCLKEANSLIRKHRVEALPILTTDGRLSSIVFRKDFREHQENPLEMLDSQKRLMVGAGINTRDYEERIPALIDAGADVICLDSSDGYSVWQKNAVEFVRKHYGHEVKIGAGNVVDRKGFLYLASVGADFVKVGIGGGAICITRDQKGIGRGQASAVIEVCQARDELFKSTGDYVPVCSDGGIVHDYHMIIALAMGADFLMMGRYFARFDESPTKIIKHRSNMYKEYWGEGANRARNWARYYDGKGEPSAQFEFEEGVDSLVPYAGQMKKTLDVSLAKLKSTMVNCGSNTLYDFRQHAVLTVVSELSLREGQAHDVIIRKELDQFI